MKDWPDGVYPVRGAMSWCHLLADADGLVLIDTGFPGDDVAIRRAVEKLGLAPRDLRAILLTHGHIDHAGNAAWAHAWSGAPIYAHPAEQLHLDGKFPYRGFAHVCRVLEAIGRGITRYTPAKIDVPFADGDVLPFWGGLRVVHLPGHTLGHCGFYAARQDVLFSGDMWSRFLMRTQVSPLIFTDDPALMLPSLRKARAVGARWIIPGHYGSPNAARLKQRFENLCEEVLRRGSVPVI